MQEKRKRWPALLFFTILITVPVISILTPDKEKSFSERRTLAKRPVWSIQSFLDGNYGGQTENWLLDQFPGRDVFRMAKAEIETRFLGKADADGYYKKEQAIYKVEDTLNEKNIRRAAEKMRQIKESYFEQTACYYSVIPDKSYYLGEDEHPKLDEEKLLELMKEQLSAAEYLNLYDQLELDDYYRTDLHWKQEEITDVAEFLAGQMKKGKEGYSDEKISEMKSDLERKETDFPEEMKETEEAKLATDQFYGAYAKASALSVKPDEMYYIENAGIRDLQVYDYEKGEKVSVYAPQKLGGMDDYDFFLWGARALLTMKNPSVKSGKKLLVFRDSFGSSIAPLLAEYYEEVTLVDLRYVSVTQAMKQLEDKEYDTVLFLYSASILNHSDSMKFY